MSTRFSRFYSFVIAVNAQNKRPQLKATKGRRTYLLIENRTANAIYINFNTQPTTDIGIEIPAGGLYELENAVPQDDIEFLGANGSTDQIINVTEGYLEDF